MRRMTNFHIFQKQLTGSHLREYSYICSNDRNTTCHRLHNMSGPCLPFASANKNMPFTHQIRHINMSNIMINFDVRKRLLHPFVLKLGFCSMYHFKIQMRKTFGQKRDHFHTFRIFTRVIVSDPANSDLFGTFSGTK
ncbi:hypothetical protein D3C78_1175260 [compost metagenome]